MFNVKSTIEKLNYVYDVDVDDGCYGLFGIINFDVKHISIGIEYL